MSFAVSASLHIVVAGVRYYSAEVSGPPSPLHLKSGILNPGDEGLFIRYILWNWQIIIYCTRLQLERSVNAMVKMIIMALRANYFDHLPGGLFLL